jgi:two-component system CheB/CheR fusion protein
VFSQHDILKDPPFGRMDLISCRNMLIYIVPETQQDILKKLHFALNLNGFIFIGPSEHIDTIRASLEEVNKKWRIYRCISKTRLYETVPSFQYPEKPASRSEQKKVKNPLSDMGGIFMETLIDDPSYAGILTDLQLDVKQAIGNYKRYLEFPEAHFNFNLLKLIHGDLSINISALARKAVQDNQPAIAKNIKIFLENEVRQVDVHIKPYLQNSNYSQQFLFVVLKETSVKETSEAHAGRKGPGTDTERVQELETELRDSRESLQAVIEELEATNEELQSANEEMISTNEELQSTNEELQSLNEELHTVSAEHQLRIKELMDLNDDMNNYFRNSESGQILVDKKLLIRRFTPSATRMVNLVSSDINRSLLDITTRFTGTNFLEDIGMVIKKGLPIEREVSVDNSVYLMRISPYERHDNKMDGVVINFIDITKVKHLDTMLQAVFKAVPNAIYALKAVRDTKKEIVDFEFIAVNISAEKMLGQTREQLVGNKARYVLQASYNELRKIYKQVVDSGKSYSYDFFNEYLNNWSSIVVVKFLDGVISVATDITEKRRAAELVEKNYEELRKSLKLNKKTQ